MATSSTQPLSYCMAHDCLSIGYVLTSPNSFVPFALFEIPSNIFLKRLKPHVWRKSPKSLLAFSVVDLLLSVLVSGCTFAFGLVTICQGLTQNYGGILTTRFFLGAYNLCRKYHMFKFVSRRYLRERHAARLLLSHVHVCRFSLRSHATMAFMFRQVV